jgi:hypothetical protein
MQLGAGSLVTHPNFGKGVVVATTTDFYSIYFNNLKEVKNVATDYEGIRVQDAKELANQTVSLTDVEAALEGIFIRMDKTQDIIPLGNKWLKGKLVIQPADASMQTKEIPIDTFFNKIIMLRDRLRVLEQNINSHSKLDNEDKIHLQQYITKCYGSLTTFNVLFKEAHHQFKGEGGA